MDEGVAVNASPLIHLAQAGLLDLLRGQHHPTVLVPRSVATEILRGGPEDPAVAALGSTEWLEVMADEPVPAGQPLPGTAGGRIRMMAQLLAAVLLLALAAGPAPAGDGVVLSLDGTPESPVAGDVYSRGQVPPITLDGTDVPDLQDDGLGGFREVVTGRLLAVSVDENLDHNLLSTLTDEEARGLRGVRFRGWNERIARQVERLDLSLVCLCFERLRGRPASRALPRLPRGVTRLIVEGYADVSAVSDLPELLLLVANDCTLPADLLAATRKLRVLTARGADLSPGPFPVLPELRRLILSDAMGITTAESLRGLPHLRLLDLSRTGVRDLSPLDGHAALRFLDASGNGVNRLPRGRLPSLGEFRAWPTEAGPEQEARFRKENPGCHAIFRVTDELRAMLGETVRLSLYGRRDYETTAAAEIAALVAAIEVDEREYRDDGYGAVGHGCRGDFDLCGTCASGGGWSCNVAHGSLYMSDRFGVVPLTPRSLAALYEWAATRGAPWGRFCFEMASYPPAVIRGHRERATAAVPPTVLYLGKRPEDGGSFRPLKEVAAILPDPVERALVAFRILGCDEAPWGVVRGPLDCVIWERILPAIPPEDLGRALARLPGDAAATRGAAKLVLLGMHPEFPPDALEAALPLLATDALSSPRAENRRRAIRGLAEIGSSAAVNALLLFLYVGFVPRPLPPGEEADAGAWWAGLETDCGRLVPDEVYAALCLARLGIADARPWIDNRLATAAGEERRTLAESAWLLGGGP